MDKPIQETDMSGQAVYYYYAPLTAEGRIGEYKGFMPFLAKGWRKKQHPHGAMLKRVIWREDNTGHTLGEVLRTEYDFGAGFETTEAAAIQRSRDEKSRDRQNALLGEMFEGPISEKDTKALENMNRRLIAWRESKVAGANNGITDEERPQASGASRPQDGTSSASIEGQARADQLVLRRRHLRVDGADRNLGF